MLALYLRDLKLGIRAGGGALTGVLFFLAVIVTIPFGVGPDLNLLARIGPAILWIGALLASLLGLDRLFQADREDGALDLLVLAEHRHMLALTVLVKCLAHWTASVLPLVIAAPLLGLFMNMNPTGIGATALTLLVGTPAITLVGAAGAAVTVALPRGGLLISVLILPLVVAFFVLRVVSPSLSVLAVLIGGGLIAWLTGRVGALPSPELSTLTWIWPQFTAGAAIGLALPLYLVTMASQNLSGLAVLKAAGYEPAPGPLIGFTGFVSLLTAPLGASTSNLAAISAAICTGPDVHPDPAERWKTGPFYALAYAIFAIFGASLVALFAVLPAALIALVAGLALLGSLANALAIALRDESQRMPAIVSFTVTASGLTLFGIGSAFWGLLAGLAVLGLEALRQRPR